MNQWSYNVPPEKGASSTDLPIPLLARDMDHSLEDLSMSVHAPKGWRLWLRWSKDFCQRISPVALLPFVIVTFIVFALGFPSRPIGGYSPLTPGPGRSSVIAESRDYDSGAAFAPADVQRLWGEYSPYYAVERYQRPPKDCQLTQVNILHRHSSRYPSHGQRKHFRRALDKLQAAKSYRHKNLRFLAKYKYKLHSNRGMMRYGVSELLDSGRKAFSRYTNLTSEQNLPFIRAAGGEGPIQSALKWAEGFGIGSNGMLQPPLATTTSSHGGFNTTLHDGNCPKAKGSKAEAHQWQRIYAEPIADRLNAAAKGLKKKLTPKDVQYLMELCAFETLAKEKYSPFCELFSKEEFEGFEYALDLGRFYSVGYGSELGPVQGVGYVNELLARLTAQPVQDNTQTNRTLDSNPQTFPLGRGIYADFTHGSLMVSVISAMGLRNSSEFEQPLDENNPSKLSKDRTWVLSKMVPFSGRLIVERMECGLPSANVSEGANGIDGSTTGKLERKWQQRQEAQGGKGSSTYVRVLMNDAVQVDICGGAGEDGLCPLEEFVKSQEYARENGKGDWEKCF